MRPLSWTDNDAENVEIRTEFKSPKFILAIRTNVFIQKASLPCRSLTRNVPSFFLIQTFMPATVSMLDYNKNSKLYTHHQISIKLSFQHDNYRMDTFCFHTHPREVKTEAAKTFIRISTFSHTLLGPDALPSFRPCRLSP